MTQPRLTAQEICDAALREFKTLPWTGSREGDRRRQVCATISVSPGELTLGIEEFTERRIKPVMLAMTKQVPSDVIFLRYLALPKNVLMAATSEYMRFILDSGCLLEGMMRFDVVFELA